MTQQGVEPRSLRFLFFIFYFFVNSGLVAGADLRGLGCPLLLGLQCSPELSRLIHRRKPFMATVVCWRRKTEVAAHPAPDQGPVMWGSASEIFLATTH